MSVPAVLLAELARRAGPPALRGLQAALVLVLSDPKLRARSEGLVRNLARRVTGNARLDDLADDLDALAGVAVAVEQESDGDQRAQAARWRQRVARLRHDLHLAARLPRDQRGAQCDAIDTARLGLLTEMLSVRSVGADPQAARARSAPNGKPH